MTQLPTWHETLNRFKKALDRLSKVVYHAKKSSSEISKLALALTFSQNFTLATQCMIKFFEDQGDLYLEPGKKIIRLAFRRGLLDDGEIWMEMLKIQNNKNKMYHREITQLATKKIIKRYHPALLKLYGTLKQEKQKSRTLYNQVRKAA